MGEPEDLRRPDVFITGERVDICAPTDQDFGVWASWFNDPAITRFLPQGKLPHTEAQQRAWYADAVASGRFIGLIKSKGARLLGVVSLSQIDYERRDCQYGIVCPVREADARNAALEALTLTVSHAMDHLRMDRVWAGHAFPGLDRWMLKQELIGFFCEGMLSSSGGSDDLFRCAARTALTRSRYERLKIARGGRLWPGHDAVERALAEDGRGESLGGHLARWLQRQHEERLNEILSLR